MKKTSIITAVGVVLFSLQTVSAQQAEEALPITKTEASTDQDDYKQIKVDNLSEIIKAAVEKDYPKASIAEAYADKIGNYKLILAMGKDTKTVYTNARGEWFDPNNKG
ncbi:hypothetical protein ATE84_0480 [Aquimarina sp. MAR_2010_214]|uniref:hypothetical protein n=1 Tax=Aquimarina sp. MAR_2010_214 TaxID=1250026 RepID=UPI000C705BD1|nr:hypothetical protein [Aquimarina sp. MAR_2010_214]PKV48481.1 hypothetical protein ATE84_0480 [Aquimarina sp. MAR_2010_214]